MKNFMFTIGSGVCAVSGTASAAATGDKIFTIVTIITSCAILIANCAIEIYRKWRDRDKDLEKDKQKNEEK